jgi:hypothetical protein
LPLRIATFAFNFNNIVLVLLMTRGGPDIPGTAIPAGKTDVPGSCTCRAASRGRVRPIIVEKPGDLRIKKFAAHGVLIPLPFAMVVSILFRERNFTTGERFPSDPTPEHWSLAFGPDDTPEDGTVVQPPYPVLLWMWNSIKMGLFAALGVLVLSTVSAYAFSRIKFIGGRNFWTAC